LLFTYYLLEILPQYCILIADKGSKQLTAEGVAMYISRNEYDAMINYYPNFMKERYITLKRKWNIAVVEVSGNYAVISELAEKINILNNADLVASRVD
jgi:hypothetical protein